MSWVWHSIGFRLSFLWVGCWRDDKNTVKTNTNTDTETETQTQTETDMEFQSTLTSWLQLQPNTTELLSDGSISDFDVNDHKYLIHCFRVAFTVLGIAIGISGIGFNTALMISSVITTSSPTTLSFQSRNLIASLAAADLFLLVFGRTLQSTTGRKLISVTVISIDLFVLLDRPALRPGRCQ